MSNQCWPDATLISSTKEDEKPECGHDKAEDGHKHDPAQRVWWVHARRGHQDPHQATTDLQGAHTQTGTLHHSGI